VSSGFGVAVHELRHLPAALVAGRRDPDEIRRRALAGVNRMLAYSRAHVPYYRDRPAYQGGPLPTLAALARLPLLDKPTVLDAGVASFHAPPGRSGGHRTDRTGGSTGRLLEVRHDIDAYGYHGATLVRRFLGSGYRPWWRIAQIKGFERPVRWFQRLGVFPRVVVPAGLPEPELARRVLAVRPHLVMGYPVMMRALLRALSTPDLIRLRRTLRLVMTDSELLTEPVARALAAGFGVPVYDEYSAQEVLTVATQCPAGSMHVDEDRVWLEIVDEAGRPVPDGEVGAVVVTHFRERAMPLVRYQLGDRAALVPGPCRCGRGFRRMRLLDGRTNDYLLLPGGRRVYSSVLLGLAQETPGVAECMMRQDPTGAITVHLVPDRGDDRSYEETVAEFSRRFAAAVTPGVPLRFVRADRVEVTAIGKGRFVESAYRPGGTDPAADGPHRPGGGADPAGDGAERPEPGADRPGDG
jgi:phenylacetate-CoA ligase